MKKTPFRFFYLLLFILLSLTNCKDEVEEKYPLLDQYTFEPQYLNIRSPLHYQYKDNTLTRIGLTNLLSYLWEQEVYPSSAYPDYCGTAMDTLRFTSIQFFENQEGKIIAGCGDLEFEKNFTYEKAENILSFSLEGYDYIADIGLDSKFTICMHSLWKYNGVDADPPYDFAGFFPCESASRNDIDFYLRMTPNEEYIKHILESTNVNADTITISPVWLSND